MATVKKVFNVVNQYTDGSDHWIEQSGEELDGSQAKVAAANTTSAAAGESTMLSTLCVTIGNASTNIDIPAPFDCEVVDAWAYKVGAGGAGDAALIKNGATTLWTSDLNVADKVKVSGTLDITHADNGFAEGDSITVDPTDVTDPSCRLFIVLRRLA